MVLGINATLIALANGTTANAPDVQTDLQNINNGGISNDGVITTSGAGDMTVVSLKTTGGGMLSYTIMPYHLLNSATINNGVTSTQTCTGVGGIPSGAKTVVVSGAFTPSAVATFAAFTPQGTMWTSTQYPASSPSPNGTTVVSFSFKVFLNTSNGQLDIKAINGNCASFDLWLLEYEI